MTAKQRIAIYRKAVVLVANSKMFNSYKIRTGLCGLFKRRFKLDIYDDAIEDFPELALFQNRQESHWYWWKTDDEGDNCRILALLFAEQIALNP